MTAEIIKLEDIFKERTKRKHEVLCFGYICELIKDISQTTNIEDIHEIFSRNLNTFKIGPRPFAAFIDAVSENDHLEMMLNHLQCLLAEIDMAESFRVARKLYPEDKQVIDLVERDFEAFCLEANRSNLDKTIIDKSSEYLNRRATPTNSLSQNLPSVGGHFSEEEVIEIAPSFN